MKQALLKIRKKQILSVIALALSIFVTPAYTFSLSSWYAEKTWHPIIALGIGSATSSDAGEAKNFPIQNPITDEFYNYLTRHITQTSVLLDGFLGAEWSLQPDWALQAGLDYNQAAFFSTSGNLIQGADPQSANTYTYHYNISVSQLLFEGKLLYTLKQYYHPYILAGLGAAFNRASDYHTSVPVNLSFTRMYSSQTTTSLSYALGLGIDADITQHLRAGLAYHYSHYGQVSLGDATIDTTRVSGTLSQANLYANELLAQLTWIID